MTCDGSQFFNYFNDVNKKDQIKLINILTKLNKK